MAKSNRDRVGEVLDALRAGVGQYVIREYKMVYKREFAREIDAALTTDRYELPRDAFADEQTLMTAIDTHGWLSLMWRRWNEVFSQKLGHAERSYVSELMTARNDWAHQKPFSNDDAHRAADTATRLLLAINAPAQAETTRAIAQELLRLRYEREQEKVKKQPPRIEEQPVTTQQGLKPWRYVVEPHPDVANGRYIQAEFAADLAQVVKGDADPEYGDPREFFRRTYLTDGLLDLLVTGVNRLAGQGGDPVVQLQTSFGGGKTHSMLAMYHLFSGQIGISEIPGGEEIMRRVGEIDDHIHANTAVLVGTAFDATNPRPYDECSTHTLWGEMAYQLGGYDAYHRVEEADLKGVSPGSDTLVSLLEDYGPCLIMIDELVAFARQLYGAERLAAGTFDAVMTFIQALTEAVRRSSDAMLLISIPESDIEIGGEGGKATLDILAKTVGRIEAVWKPVTANESFEIVRRRLFSSEIDYAARDATLSAFRDMYIANKTEYPSGVSDGEYYDRMRAAYPIHPELFDRLYQDWSTLERFQRTRGVLRLMAAVIHQLWHHNDQSLMIMPGSLPLDTATVRNEMLRYLPENWPAIVDTDIDGLDSRPFVADKDNPTMGRYSASRRVARTIFVGSAPSVTEQSVRGVEGVRINLATVQPGEPLAVFGDALRRLSNQLTYLYSDGSRYWYDTRPTVNRIAQDRAQTVSGDDIYQEAVTRLRKVRKQNFEGYHIAPQSSGDIADDWVARIVVLPPDASHKRSDDQSEALQFAREILETRGNAPRLYRNMLVFIAPDLGATDAFEKALRDYLAWLSISHEEEQLNLDAQQRKQVRTNLDRTNETVDSRLLETYSWLLVPYQPDPTGPVQWQTLRISGQDNFYDRAYRKLQQSELLIPQWAGHNLSMELNKHLWRNEAHLGVKQLWEYLARYCYLPRLVDHNVLTNAIADGVSLDDAPFAYADLFDGESYKGLRFRERGRVLLNDQSVIVHPEVAEEYLAAIQQPVETTSVDARTPVRPDQRPTPTIADAPPEPEKPVVKRYYGAVSLDPQRVNREVGTIVEEIIERLTSLVGTEVEVTLEIHASRPEGFDEATIRTISENSHTLKFDEHSFEQD